MAPCLGGGPLASPARALVNAAGELGSAPWASLVRASCVLYLFDAMEHAFASDREPTAAIQAALGRMSGLVHAAVATGFARPGVTAINVVTSPYGRYFSEWLRRGG